MYNYVLNEIGFMRNDTTASFSAFKTQKLQSCFLCAVEMQKDTPRPRLPTKTQLLLCDEQNDAHGVDDDEAGQDVELEQWIVFHLKVWKKKMTYTKNVKFYFNKWVNPGIFLFFIFVLLSSQFKNILKKL